MNATPTVKNPYEVVGTIDLGKVHGTTPATRIQNLVRRANEWLVESGRTDIRLSAAFAGEGIRRSGQGTHDSTRDIAHCPPKNGNRDDSNDAGNPTGMILNVYDPEVLEILTNALSESY